MRKNLTLGFIPILDFESYMNFLNGFVIDSLKGNSWE